MNPLDKKESKNKELCPGGFERAIESGQRFEYGGQPSGGQLARAHLVDGRAGLRCACSPTRRSRSNRCNHAAWSGGWQALGKSGAIGSTALASADLTPERGPRAAE